MKGYLWVQPVMEIHREFKHAEGDDLVPVRTSLEGLGWVPLDAAIKEGSYWKVSATGNGVRYEARVFVGNGPALAGSGTYEIRHGPLAGHGAFVDVVRVKPYLGFAVVFHCHSSSGEGKSQLKWCIGANEVVDANALPGED